MYETVLVLCHFVLIRIQNVSNAYKNWKHPNIFTIAGATKNQNNICRAIRPELL